MARLQTGASGLASRLTLFPWHCDFNGHLNSRFAAAFADDVSDAVFTVLGLGRAEVTAAGCLLVVARTEIDYLAQAFAGEVVEIHYEVGRIGRSSMILDLRFTVIGAAPRPIVHLRYTIVLVAQATGKSLPWREAGFIEEPPP